MNDEIQYGRADTSVRPYTTRAGGPCPYTDQSPTMGRHKASPYDRPIRAGEPRPYI